MGYRSIVYGRIIGSRFNYGYNAGLNNDPLLYHKLNRLTIDLLPEEDDFPQLTRQMFNLPGLDFKDGLYKNQIIVFGASYKEIEDSWIDWIVKFEHLLKALYWDEVVVHLETECRGDRTYQWKNNNDPG